MPEPKSAENGKIEEPNVPTEPTKTEGTGNEGPPAEGTDQFEDDLEALFADPTEGPPVEGEKDVEVEVGEEKVKLSDLIKSHTDKKTWQKSNTEKAQELAERERRIQEHNAEMERKERELRALESNLYQRIPNQESGALEDEDLGVKLDEFSDPALAAIAKTVQALKADLKKNQQTFEQQQFINQTRAVHSELASKYPDYDPAVVETRIIDGRANRFEDAHKAMQFEKIQKADPEMIKKLIPDSMVQQIRAEERKKLITEANKRLKLRKEGMTPKPKAGVSKTPKEGLPKTYHDIKDEALEMIDEMQNKGQPLFK